MADLVQAKKWPAIGETAGQCWRIKAMLLSDVALVKYEALRMPQAQKWLAEDDYLSRPVLRRLCLLPALDQNSTDLYSYAMNKLR